jgi:hypothetical protein
VSDQLSEQHARQERLDEEELLEAAERRRANADSFAWGVPGLAIAAEAFLLTIALAADTKPLGRLLAALAGTFVIIGTLHFLSKQAVYFQMYDTVIERQRHRLGRTSLHRETLDRLDLPDHVSRPHRSWFSWNLRSVLVWKAVLWALILIDVFIVGYAIWEIADDPGWLSRPSS